MAVVKSNATIRLRRCGRADIVLNKLYKTGTSGVSSSDTVELTFRWVDGTDNNDIKLTAYITSASIGAATGDIVRAEIAFQGTGALSTVTIS